MSRVASAFVQVRWASILVVAVALGAYFAFTSPAFLTSSNLLTIAGFLCATAIVASGEVMLMICGEIDLSVGMVAALAPYGLDGRLPLPPVTPESPLADRLAYVAATEEGVSHRPTGEPRPVPSCEESEAHHLLPPLHGSVTVCHGEVQMPKPEDRRCRHIDILRR